MAVREWRSLEEADVSNSTRTVPSVCVCVCYFGTMGYGTLRSSDSIGALASLDDIGALLSSDSIGAWREKKSRYVRVCESYGTLVSS